MRLDKYTQRAQEAVFEAQSQAEAFNHPQIEPEHLLLALLKQDEGVAPQIVLGLGRNPAELEARVEAELQRKPKVYGTATQVGVGAGLQRVLQAAQAEADAMRDDYVSTEHLFLALASKEANGAQKVLAAAGISKDAILKALQTIRGSQRVTSQNPEVTYQALAKYGRDLTDLARKGKLDPVIGRDEEIRRVIQILSRRTKNNPVLIGEPGVGKTAIAEGLALRIVRGDVFASLHLRPLPARQGHRPDRRGCEPAPHGDHQRSGRAGRDQAQGDAVGDRARGTEAREGQDQQRAPGADRARSGRPGRAAAGAGQPALALLRGDFGEGNTVVADVRDGHIVFHRQGEAEIVDAEFKVL